MSDILNAVARVIGSAKDECLIGFFVVGLAVSWASVPVGVVRVRA